MAGILKGWAVWLMALVLVQHAMISAVVAQEASTSSECFKSIFAFGDGMFDTGSMSHIFPSILNYDFEPYGSTHFGKPSGRFSDGRLVLDFLSESLGLPKIPSYADTVTSDFSTGISFASAFSTLGKVGTGQGAGPYMFLNPFPIGVQMAHYVEFKATTLEVINKGTKTTKKSKRALLQEAEVNAEAVVESSTLLPEEAAMARLPTGSEFNKGLYLIASGAHDIINFYNQNYTEPRIEGKFSDLISQYHLAVRSLAKLYQVKNIVVFDVEPLGCQPFLLTLLPHSEEDLDAKGCLISVNGLVQKFNRKLRRDVPKWAKDFNANVYFLSQYDIKIDMLNDAASGFEKTSVACCGVPVSPHNVLIPVPCGPSVFDPVSNSTIQATACAYPSTHVYWDGMYTTEAANKYLTQKILTGNYFDPPFETLTSCAKPIE